MKNSFLDFTRGSQLLGHFGCMFAAGLKVPLFATLGLVAAIFWWRIGSELDEYDAYLLWMKAYVAGYTFLEFDPDKLVSLRLPDGENVTRPIRTAREFQPIRETWTMFLSTARQSLLLAFSASAPLLGAYWWFAEHFGARSKRKRHLRGAQLVSHSRLVADLTRYNRGRRAREYRRELGWRWRLARKDMLEAAKLYTPAHLGGLSWPWRCEQSHAMIVGTTGMGKTVVLTELVDEIRARGQRAVIFDLTGAFIERFYDSRRDVILNPLDARCPAWSVFDDCTTSAEFHAAAEALVPNDGGGAEQFWVLAARTLFVESCLKLAEKGRGTNAALASDLMNASLSDLHALLEGTMAAPFTNPEAARMAESVRAVLNVNAKALQMLPAHGPRFSIRDWIRTEPSGGSLLFLSARYIDMGVLSQLLTLWLDTAINALMTGSPTTDLKVWILIDELGALHRLPSLEKGMQTARNFGGAIITGVHAYAKLKEVYGENMAMTLSSLARTKLLLGTADRETAAWCSDIVGYREVREMEESYSYAFDKTRDAVTMAPRREVVPLVLPDQFMGLRSLQGYIKFAEGFAAAPLTLVPRDWPRIAQGFIPRAIAPSGKSVAPGASSPPRPDLGDRRGEGDGNSGGAGPHGQGSARGMTEPPEADSHSAADRRSPIERDTSSHGAHGVRDAPSGSSGQIPPLPRQGEFLLGDGAATGREQGPGMTPEQPPRYPNNGAGPSRGPGRAPRVGKDARDFGDIDPNL